MTRFLLVVSVLLAALLSPLSAGAAAPIYDEAADGAKAVAEAKVRAKKEGKQLLLQFGANWCGWCHKLHDLFESDAQIAEVLKQKFVVVLIDVNKGHNSEVDRQYGNPTRLGLPVIVIADAEGKRLTTQDTGKLEEGDHHNAAKVLAFLRDDARPKDQPPRAPLLPQVEALQKQALVVIGKENPKLDTDTLVFQAISYELLPRTGGFFESISVQYIDPATRREDKQDGRNVIIHEGIHVHIEHSPDEAERVYVGGATHTEFR